MVIVKMSVLDRSADIKRIDEGIRNKFRWSWLENKDSMDIFLSEYVRKIDESVLKETEMSVEEICSHVLDKYAEIPATQWLQALLHLTEDDFIDFIQQDLSVLQHSFSCKCVSLFDEVCCCAEEIELMRSIGPLEILCDNVCQLHAMGACPHFTNALMSSNFLYREDCCFGFCPTIVDKDMFRDLDHHLEYNNTSQAQRILNSIPGDVMKMFTKVYSCHVFHFAVFLQKEKVLDWLFTNDHSLFPHISGVFLDSEKSAAWRSIRLCIRYNHLSTLDMILQKITRFISTYTPVFAVKENNMEAVKILLRYYRRCGRSMYKSGLSVSLLQAFSENNLEAVSSLKRISKHFSGNRHSFFSGFQIFEHCLNNVVEYNSKLLMREFLKIKIKFCYSKEKIPGLIFQAVKQDKPEMLDIILEKARKGDIQEVLKKDLLTQCVYNNSPATLHSIVNTGASFNIDNKFKFTALDWAVFLNFDECESVLKQIKYPCFRHHLIDSSPVLSLFDVECMDDQRLQLLDILIKAGHDVNFENPNGITPTQRALQTGNLKCVKILLLNGARPFEGQTFFLYLNKSGLRQFLIYLLICNVNCSGYFDVIEKFIFDGFSEYHHTTTVHFISIFLEHHHMSPRDLKYIECRFGLYDSGLNYYAGFPNLRETLTHMLLQPKSLQLLCKNSIRYFYPRSRVFTFVENTDLPADLKDFLLLKNYRCLVTDVQYRRRCETV